MSEQKRKFKESKSSLFTAAEATVLLFTDHGDILQIFCENPFTSSEYKCYRRGFSELRSDFYLFHQD